MAKPVKITEVVLRDAHQSLLATRMTMDEMRPILPAMDEVGYYSVECWGGATFDACIRFLDEDPWDRLRILRKEMPNTKLQMLFRGQNTVSYTHLDVYKRQPFTLAKGLLVSLLTFLIYKPLSPILHGRH